MSYFGYGDVELDFSAMLWHLLIVKPVFFSLKIFKEARYACTLHDTA